MKRVCKPCGAVVPLGHFVCPLCGEAVVGLDDLPPLPPSPSSSPSPSPAAPELAAFAREVATERNRARRVGRAGLAIEAVLFVLAIPVLVPGFLTTALFVRRWGQVPLSLVLIEGVLLTGLSYLGYHDGEGSLLSLAFPILLASCFSVAALFVLRGATGRLQGGILLGYSGLVTLLMIGGGGLLYVCAGLVWHRGQAPLYRKIVSDVPRVLSPAKALAVPDRIAHVELEGASLDASKAAWRVEGGGVDVHVSAAAEEPLEASASDLFKKSDEWLGRRVSLISPDTSGVGKMIPDDWRSFVSTAALKGRRRFWMPVGGIPKERIYLVSGFVEENDPRTVKDILDLEAPAGILAAIPRELLESPNGLDVRGRAPGDSKGLALVAEASPRRWCAPVAGTGGALWVAAEGEEAPTPPFRGVLERPEDPSLAALARRQLGATASPRVLVLGNVAAYRNAHGLRTEASEGPPLEQVGGLLLGALLTAVAVFLALRE